MLYDVDPGQPWLDPLSIEGLNGNAAVGSIMELPNQRIIRAAGMSVRLMSEEQVWGLDRSSGRDNAFTVAFMKPHPSRNFDSHQTFGHEGANAALGFADPAYGLSFGYIPQRAEDGRTPGRAHRLAAEIRRAAAALS